MASGIWAAASGAVSQVAHLDNASNNLANLDTPGFRADRMVFRNVLRSELSGSAVHPSLEHNVIRSVSHDMRAGRIVPTGRSLDVALPEANQFFAVGADAGVRFTRAGSLHVQPNGLVTGPSGIPYLGQGGQPLIVPAGAGEVGVSRNGDLLIDGQPDGQRLMVVKFANFEALEKEGNVLFRAPARAGAAEVIDEFALETQALEKSTDQAFLHMSSVVEASRNFNMLTEVIQAFKSVEERAARDIVG
ncbi:MAG: flagellar hook-basal body complex protein [Polyangiaceae bacterium]|nr:flagellar hook-basal body complex protein [Polyangiaceae bacterium]